MKLPGIRCAVTYSRIMFVRFPFFLWPEKGFSTDIIPLKTPPVEVARESRARWSMKIYVYTFVKVQLPRNPAWFDSRRNSERNYVRNVRNRSSKANTTLSYCSQSYILHRYRDCAYIQYLKCRINNTDFACWSQLMSL